MKLRIFTRLFIAMLLGVTVPLAVMMASVHWTFRQGFEDYLHRVELKRLEQLTGFLADQYRTAGNWDFLKHDHHRWFDLLRRGLHDRSSRSESDPVPEPQGPPPDAAFADAPPFHPGPPDDPDARPPRRPRHGPPPPPDPLLLGLRLRLLDADRHPVTRPPPPPRSDGPPPGPESLLPISVDGATVGWLGVRRNTLLTDRMALAFVDSQSRSNALILLFALLLALLVAWILARQLIRPVRRIATGVRRLASGDYTVAVAAGSDELGDLARDFNLLGRTLQRNEEVRRDWIADISHELRTPLTVLRGEIEAMQDGVRPLSVEGVASLHAEVLSLGKLVDDLYELSLSDLGALDYRREPVSLAEIVVSAVETHRHRFEDKGVALTLGPMRPAVVYGDRRRLGQLLGNLLENSVRYTDAGGRCEVGLEATATTSVVTIDDSAPGVPVELHDRLFERLYRVEGARTREHGGAGLGLAICRNIVEAHGGRIAALASPLGGLRIRMELPRERD